jgi:hypothetical protein
MRQILVILILSCLFFSACSKSMSSITPEITSDSSVDNSHYPLFVNEWDRVESKFFILSAYELIVDAENMSAKLTPKRTLDRIGDSFLVEGMYYFSAEPCSECFELESIGLNPDDLIELVFHVKHPFEPGNTQNPPSGKNRLDLDIFDLALVIVPENRDSYLFTQSGLRVYNDVCARADGYTRELSELTQETAACPYYLVIDNSDTTVSNFNEFPMGSEQSFSTMFNIEGQIRFNLYLTMGYGASSKFASRLTPSYFNPEFNKKGAWKVQIVAPEGDDPPSAWNTWNESDSTTEHIVTVKVWDWQHGVISISDPPVNPGDIVSPSDVSIVRLEIEGMTTNLKEVTSPVSGTGRDPSDPLIFEIPVANENLLPEGEYAGVVQVLDERIPPSDGIPGDIDMLVQGQSKGQLGWFNLPEFATYQVFTATVVGTPCTAQGSITPDYDDYYAYNGETLDFDVDAVTMGGDITDYWVDWGSGTYTESNTTGNFTHQFIDSDCPGFADDVLDVRFGVELDCNPGNILLIDSTTVSIRSCSNLLLPVENIILTVNRLDVDQRYGIDTEKPYTLSWDDPGGLAFDYVIYWDNNPSDGLSNNFQLAGSTQSTGWDTPASHLNVDGSHFVKGITYIVYSRRSNGVECSTGSQIAHVIVSDAETSSGLEPYNMQGWMTNNKSGDDSMYMDVPYTQFLMAAVGNLAIRFGHKVGVADVGEWEGISRPTPNVPDSSVRRLDFSMLRYRFG